MTLTHTFECLEKMELAQAVSEQAEQNKEERASNARVMRASNFFLGW